MKQTEKDLQYLLKDAGKGELLGWTLLPQSGGDRKYYRLRINEKDTTTLLATFNNNISENTTFIQWSKKLKENGIPVPEIIAESADGKWYLQEDLGDVNLLQLREKNGLTPEVFELYRQSLHYLAAIQVKGDNVLDYSISSGPHNFTRTAIFHDLLYFKFYFADALSLPYNREVLLNELENVALQLENSRFRFFMYRDFQGRNIMVKNDQVYFIDYQGGMKGPAAYDVAALLWQARAELPVEWKEKLLELYMEQLQEYVPDLNRDVFRAEYSHMVLIRILQVLGAYGFRGMFQKKEHFRKSILPALNRLDEYVSAVGLPGALPELSQLIIRTISEEVKEKFRDVRAKKESPLLVTINSFSFIQRGYPPDESGNGGGFVFDCRGILNPGRLEEFKSLTGRDEQVKLFLETKTRMPEFLQTVFDTVDVTVENYLDRDFEKLTVNFGCTGGQHRSVYAADALAHHLEEKYGVKTQVNHLEQNFSA